jgi:hypothetical protein
MTKEIDELGNSYCKNEHLETRSFSFRKYVEMDEEDIVEVEYSDKVGSGKKIVLKPMNIDFSLDPMDDMVEIDKQNVEYCLLLNLVMDFNGEVQQY